MPKLDLTLVSDIDPDTYYNLNFGVMDFANDLKHAVRGICTAPRSNISVWVYRKQDTYAMGYIAYGAFQDKPDAAEQYCVFSPNISNGKYNYGDRMHMATSADRAKAVKNAAKYLRPLDTKQVLAQAQDGFTDKIQDAIAVSRKELRSAITPVNTTLFEYNPYRDVEQCALHKELRHMIQSGHEFLDKHLEAELKAAFTAMDTQLELRRTHDAPHTFVEMMTTNGEPLFRGFDEVGRGRDAMVYGLHGDAFVYQQHDLPENLAGGISVLSMVDVGQYVAGVGYRAAPNMFYIAQGGDE